MSGAPSDRILQRWGVVAGAGVVAAALVASTITQPEEAAPEPEEPASATSSPVPEDPPGASPAPAPAKGAEPAATPGEARAEPIAEPAQVGGPPPTGANYPSLLVRFEAPHPMARAQALEAEGRHAEAVESARQTIRTRRDLRGLCYDRFTNGGAEIVLRACSAVPHAQRARFQETWSQRLNAAAGVDYAEPNYTLYPEAE